MSIKRENLPWVEKFRPKKLEDLKFQEDILNTINKSINNRNFPHLLFYGPPGSGKTTCALAICLKLYGPKMMRSRVLELNASDERGIKVVREKVKNYAKLALSIPDKKYNYPCPKFKIIILDEADAMTTDSQFALRRIIEKYSATTRFILTCNYISKIVSPILSRCIGFQFRALDINSAYTILNEIVVKEDIKVKKDAIKEIYNMCNGDMRLSINLLQKVTYNTKKIIDKEIVRENYGLIKTNIIDNIITKLENDTSNKSILKITYYLLNQGYSVKLILESFAKYFKENKILNENNLCKIYFKLSDIDNFSNSSGNQLIAILSVLNYLAILLIENK
jgi:replication factor C subunit 2/4